MPLLQRKKVIKFIPCINYAEINDHVSALVCSLVKKNKNTVLGFSVGITMEDLYNKIITKAHKQKISFKNTITFNTDEYLETHKHHQKHTKTSFMKEHLFSKLDIKLENTNFPTSKNYKTYDKKIKALGGIDLLILTIGVNGYVGANEPDTKFHS
jgi:glucosamine-6-phosphate deaminase